MKLQYLKSLLKAINYFRNNDIEINNIIENDRDFSDNNYNGKKDAPVFLYIKGESNVLISAPHAVNQLRDGKLKFSEPYTGAIAKYLNKTTKTHAFIKTQYDGTDPNWINGFEYKNKLSQLVKENNISLLIDLHCMSNKRSKEIIISTNSLKNVQGDNFFVNQFIENFKKEGFTNIEHDIIFKAKKDYNISKYISMVNGIPAIQIEVNMDLFNPTKDNGVKLKKIINCLGAFVKEAEMHIKNKKIEKGYDI